MMFALLRKRPSARREAGPIAPTGAFRIAQHVLTASREGRVTLLDQRRERYLGLDDVGSALWRRLEAGRTVREISIELAGEYDADVDAIEADVVAFIAELRNADLVVPA